MNSPTLRSMASAVLLALFVVSACDTGKDLGGDSTGADGTADDGTADDGTDDGSSGETTGGDGEVTNGCGTFDTSLPGDSPIPQDPDDPEILDACTSLCDVLGETCASTTDDCLTLCKMRSCDVCPGTLAPFVECQAAEVDPAACTCDAEGLTCDVAEVCLDSYYALSQCGG